MIFSPKFYKFFPIILCTLILCNCVAQSPTLKWEYKVLRISDYVVGPFFNMVGEREAISETGELIENSANPKLQDKLDQLGKEGWELVGFSDNDGVNAVLIFKRPR